MADVTDRSQQAEVWAELQRRVRAIQTPFGDEPHLRQREAALDWLLAHSDLAHPVLLDLLQSGRATNRKAMMMAIARFGRLESVVVLQQALMAGDEAAWTAGAALAAHPAPEALDVLFSALQSEQSIVVIAAADAVMARADRRACATLKVALNQLDNVTRLSDEMRYHLVQAAGSLGCLDSEFLAHLATSDPDDDIRTLAADFLNCSKSRG